MEQTDFKRVRQAIARIPGDISNDAIGAKAPRVEDIFSPESHASALDPEIPVVVGSRGAGKSFWSGVLGQNETRDAAAVAYPHLRLDRVDVHFGFTGVGGSGGVSDEALNESVPEDASPADAKAFWWATILRAAARNAGKRSTIAGLIATGRNWERREHLLAEHDARLGAKKQTLLIVYDALDRVAINWPRRRLLTAALLEVAWATRAYRNIKVKLFLRPDQLNDDALKFVELPKLRTGAVRLMWSGADLYGLFYSRLSQTDDAEGRDAFARVIARKGLALPDKQAVWERTWPLASDINAQARVMDLLAGPYMSEGPHGYKKGKTFDWPLKHLADAFDEVTPRSFLGLLIAAASHGPTPTSRAIVSEGIRHGLRAASRTRVDQLHLEFPWIKGVLAPLSGLLLPTHEDEVKAVWSKAETVSQLVQDAHNQSYLAPFSDAGPPNERGLLDALQRIGVMFQRKDERIDMPDLFRVAARLLKKGATAPL